MEVSLKEYKVKGEIISCQCQFSTFYLNHLAVELQPKALTMHQAHQELKQHLHLTTTIRERDVSLQSDIKNATNTQDIIASDWNIGSDCNHNNKKEITSNRHNNPNKNQHC